jgi:hypothetical protein
VTDGTRAPVEEIGDDATAEVAERAREQLWTSAGTLLLYAAGAAMLALEPWDWSPELWLGSAALLVAVLGGIVWEFGTERGRCGRAGQLLAEYAVLHHVDPGVGRRAPADDVARDSVRFRLLAWLLPLGLGIWPLVGGTWHRPAWAAPGVALLAVSTAVQLAAQEREARAGRCWLADPPGPPRD